MFPIAVLLFVSVSQLPVLNSKSVGFDSSPFCQHDPRVEAFATTYFTARTVDKGCDVVSGVEVSGKDAAKTEHDVVFEILTKEGMCSADWAAYTTGRPFLALDNVTVPYYMEKSAHSVGKVLLQHGLFDCQNSVSLALEWFNLARNASRGLDEHKFESYQRGNVQGLVDLIHEHGLDVSIVFNDVAFSFFSEFEESHQSGCTKTNN